MIKINFVMLLVPVIISILSLSIYHDIYNNDIILQKIDNFTMPHEGYFYFDNILKTNNSFTDRYVNLFNRTFTKQITKEQKYQLFIKPVVKYQINDKIFTFDGIKNFVENKQNIMAYHMIENIYDSVNDNREICTFWSRNMNVNYKCPQNYNPIIFNNKNTIILNNTHSITKRENDIVDGYQISGTRQVTDNVYVDSNNDMVVIGYYNGYVITKNNIEIFIVNKEIGKDEIMELFIKNKKMYKNFRILCIIFMIFIMLACVILNFF